MNPEVITIPDHVLLKFAPGAKLLIEAGVKLLIQGGISAGPYQIFSAVLPDTPTPTPPLPPLPPPRGSLVIESVRVPVLYPEWFGASLGRHDAFNVTDAVTLDSRGGRWPRRSTESDGQKRKRRRALYTRRGHGLRQRRGGYALVGYSHARGVSGLCAARRAQERSV